MSDDVIAVERICWDGYHAAAQMRPKTHNPYGYDPVKTKYWLQGYDQHAARQPYIAFSWAK